MVSFEKVQSNPILSRSLIYEIQNTTNEILNFLIVYVQVTLPLT